MPPRNKIVLKQPERPAVDAVPAPAAEVVPAPAVPASEAVLPSPKVSKGFLPLAPFPVERPQYFILPTKEVISIGSNGDSLVEVVGVEGGSVELIVTRRGQKFKKSDCLPLTV